MTDTADRKGVFIQLSRFLHRDPVEYLSAEPKHASNRQPVGPNEPVLYLIAFSEDFLYAIGIPTYSWTSLVQSVLFLQPYISTDNPT